MLWQAIVETVGSRPIAVVTRSLKYEASKKRLLLSADVFSCVVPDEVYATFLNPRTTEITKLIIDEASKIGRPSLIEMALFHNKAEIIALYSPCSTTGGSRGRGRAA